VGTTNLKQQAFLEFPFVQLPEVAVRSKRFNRESLLAEQEFDSMMLEKTVLSKQAQTYLIHTLREARIGGK
jgi:hypothetical protein